MLLSKNAAEYDVSQLSVETGVYNRIFSIPLRRPKFAMAEINSVAVSPRDLKAYMTALVDGVDYYLLRFDQVNVELIAKLPHPSRYGIRKAFSYNTGGFSTSGRYCLVIKGKKQVLFFVEDLHGYAGYESRKYSEIPDLTTTLTGFTLSNADLIADVAVVSMDLDGTGQVADYAFMLDRKLVLYVVKLSIPAYRLWRVTTTGVGLTPASENGFGAAWSYEGRVFFASNAGGGVFEVDTKSMDLIAETVIMRHVGKSEATTDNDGMNCLGAKSPWPPLAGCADGMIEVDSVNGQCPAGSTGQSR